MSRKRKKIKRQHQLDPYDILEGRINITLHQLARMIHRLNPTNETISPEEKIKRYQIKSRLQSLLIRRFGEELEVEQPDPDNPQLVGFKLRHFDDTACHALLNELDEDARSWTQRMIDEEKMANHQAYETPSATGPLHVTEERKTGDNKDALTEEQLIALGKQAMSEYDYSSSQEYLHRALSLSPGNVKAALPLLELLIDHLAAYDTALEISQLFSRIVLEDEEVRVFLALAAVRSGQTERALEYVHRISHPRVPEIYLLATKNAIRRSDADQAEAYLTRLKAFEKPVLKTEMDRVQQDLHALQTQSLKPLEDEMMKAFEDQSFENAFDLSERLLELWPENEAARHIYKTIKKQRRNDRITMILHQANDARKNEDYLHEVALLTKAISLGAHEKKLADRMQHSRMKAQQKSEQEEINCIKKLWADKERKNALELFLGLGKKQRKRIMADLLDPHFTWAEQILNSKAALKPDKIAQAVLTLGKCNEELSTSEEPQCIVSQLKEHNKAFQALPKAQELLQRAEIMTQELEHKKLRSILDQAEHFLKTGDLKEAHESLEHVKLRCLNTDERNRCKNMLQRLHWEDKVYRLSQHYANFVSHAKHLDARNCAVQLAKLHKGQKSFQHWQKKIAEQSDFLHKQWCCVTIDITDMPGCYGSLGLESYHDERKCCMHEDGRHLIIASSHERWVFIRLFCMDDQSFKKVAIVRVPRALRFNTMNLDNGSIWIAGDGNVLEMGAEDFNILSWYDYHDSSRRGEKIDSTRFFPKNKRLWLEKSSSRGEFFDSFFQEIIDIEHSTVVNKKNLGEFLISINRGDGFCIAVQEDFSNTIRIYSERGKLIDRILLETSGIVDKAAIHPNGIDYVFLPYNDSNEFDNFLKGIEERPCLKEAYTLNIEVTPGAEKNSKPIRIDDSDGQMIHDIATSRALGIFFILYRTNSQEDPIHKLAGYKPVKHGLEKIYQITIPKKIQFAHDPSARHVIVINPSDRGLQAIRLDASPPEFDLNTSKAINWDALPSFEPPFTCNNPTGNFHENCLAYLRDLDTRSPVEISKLAQGIKYDRSCSPEEASAFIQALKYKGYWNEADELKLWLREKYPDHNRVLIDMACEAIEKREWDTIVRLLSPISRNQLDEGTARHVCHLLGMGYFVNHEIEKALHIWEEGLLYRHGFCELDAYIEYAKLSKAPLKEGEYEGTKNDILTILNLYKMTDVYVNECKWDAVIESLERSNVLKIKDLQINARFAEAYLHKNYRRAEERWFYKIVTLAHYCEFYYENDLRINQMLPSFIERWPESRLSDTATRAQEWLEFQIC